MGALLAATASHALTEPSLELIHFIANIFVVFYRFDYKGTIYEYNCALDGLNKRFDIQFRDSMPNSISGSKLW